MPPTQPGILKPIPQLARYLSFGLVDTSAASDVLSRLATEVDLAASVIGVGRATVRALGAEVPGLRDLEVHTGPGIEVPSTRRCVAWSVPTTASPTRSSGSPVR